jgi:hypothetical protein
MTDRFPPLFQDNPFSYGFALFSLTVVSAIFLAILIGWGLESRRTKEIDRLVGNEIPPPMGLGFDLTPFRAHRIILSGLMLTIVMGALPDAVFLMAWGEVSNGTINAILAVDRACDGVLIVPAMVSVMFLVVSGQGMEHRLHFNAVHRPFKPTWSLIRDKLKIAGVVLLIAVGVTYAKSLA